MKLLFKGVFVAVAALTMAAPSFAEADEYWTGSNGGELGTAGNWNSGTILTDYDLGYITGGNSAVVSTQYPIPPDGSWVYIGQLFVGEGTAGASGLSYTPGPASLTIQANGTFGAYYLNAGDATAGAVRQSGGVLTVASLKLGLNGGSGYANITGGTMVPKGGDGIQIGAGGYGVLDQTGGSMSAVANIDVGYYGDGGFGAYNLSGGTASVTWTTNIAEWNNSTGVLTVSHNGVLSNTLNITVGAAINGAGTGIVNVGAAGVGGGFISTPNIVVGSTSVGTVNFHGGTLQASRDTGDSTGLWSGDGTGNTGLLIGTTNYVYGEGAKIDSNGHSVLIATPLQAPGGKGVASIALTGVTTSGYIGAPVVQITDPTGQGATAQATIDPATGRVTGITITNPGTGYTNPTIALVGGGGAYAGTFAAPSLANNVSGGLTKIGTGSLTLSAVNSYTGSTVVNQGTLVLAATGSIASSHNIVVQLGAILDVSAQPGFSLASEVLSGHGHVTGSVVVPAASELVGSLTIGQNANLSSGGLFEWALSDLTDNRSGVAGADFDQLLVGGNLTLGGTSQLGLDFTALPAAEQPGAATVDSFWKAPHDWTIIESSNTASQSFTQLLDASFASGSFSASIVSGGVDLHFTPVPEPSTIALLALAALGFAGYWTRRK